MEKDAGPKAWVKYILRQLINSTVAGKSVAYIPRDFVRKSLKEQNGSPFSQRIVEAAPLKKLPQPKCNIYNYRTNHVRYYQQVLAYWILDNAMMCHMLPASLGEITLRWFTRLPLVK